jgi:hypothetical protein
VSDDQATPHHHTLRERLDAAEAAADEVVAEESGQLGGEVNALAVPFEEVAAAVRAAIHPDRVADAEVKAEAEAEAQAQAGAVEPVGSEPVPSEHSPVRPNDTPGDGTGH